MQLDPTNDVLDVPGKEHAAERANVNTEIGLKSPKRLVEEAITSRSADLQSQSPEEGPIFSQAVAQIPLSIVIADLNGCIIYVNAKFTELTGYSSHEVVGQNLRLLESDQAAYEDFKRMWETVTTGAVCCGELRKRKKNGQLYWESAHITPLFNTEGDVTHYLAVKEDVTLRKENEFRMEAARQHDVSLSRQAGMAEVATSILHNVGNVLNSINVSTAVVDHQVRKSRVTAVSRLAKLMEDHSGDLAAFLTNDPKGRLVPEFLVQVAETLRCEQVALIKELANLRRNVDHVNEIVAMQQSYARTSGVFEHIEVNQLLDDTLRMNASFLECHEIKVIRDYGVLPEICTDKHKVVQILINLVRNATDACNELGGTDKRVTVRGTDEGNWVSISIIDSGIGILSEDLVRIFNHGFTTKKGSHGYGLHSGALAAKELGGTITATSNGRGFGATFTLELPHQPPPVKDEKLNQRFQLSASSG